MRATNTLHIGPSIADRRRRDAVAHHLVSATVRVEQLALQAVAIGALVLRDVSFLPMETADLNDLARAALAVSDQLTLVAKVVARRAARPALPRLVDDAIVDQDEGGNVRYLSPERH